MDVEDVHVEQDAVVEKLGFHTDFVIRQGVGFEGGRNTRQGQVRTARLVTARNPHVSHRGSGDPIADAHVVGGHRFMRSLVEKTDGGNDRAVAVLAEHLVVFRVAHATEGFQLLCEVIGQVAEPCVLGVGRGQLPGKQGVDTGNRYAPECQGTG